jgi:hypothetical protein
VTLVLFVLGYEAWHTLIPRVAGALRQQGLARHAHGAVRRSVLMWEYKPHGNHRSIQTNRYGFRDSDFDSRASRRAWRVAFVGDSVTLGLGVELDQTFERLIVKRRAGTRRSCRSRRSTSESTATTRRRSPSCSGPGCFHSSRTASST